LVKALIEKEIGIEIGIDAYPSIAIPIPIAISTPFSLHNLLKIQELPLWIEARPSRKTSLPSVGPDLCTPDIVKRMISATTYQRMSEVFERYGSDIVCAYLFGSEARGEAGPDSDVDVAVLFQHEPPLTLDGLGLDLAAALEDVLGRPVDLVVLDRASPDLVHRVLRDGILVYEADRAARVRFEVRSRAEYFDVLPYLQEYRRVAGAPHDRQ
jgi:hypothetical protein